MCKLYFIMYNPPMASTTIFFDLDATLYPESNGLWRAIRKRIDEYMHKRVGIPKDDIPALRRLYYDQFGTTLRGLQINFQVDPNDYLFYVHDLPLEKYLHPDPILRDLLLSLPHRRWILTNADSLHANRVMNLIGIENCFEGIIDIWSLDPYCKPQKEAYHRALILAAVSDSRTCALVDDSPRNLSPARKLGFFTILVGNGPHPSAHRNAYNITDLRGEVPELWTRISLTNLSRD